MMTMTQNIRLSTQARQVVTQTQFPLETVQRMIVQHKREPMERTLPTPKGKMDVLVSLHKLYAGTAPVNLVMVQRIANGNLALYTENEFKDILKESLGLRSL